MTEATQVPHWMTAVNAAPGSAQPHRTGMTLRWAVLLMGRNSVRPWMMPRATASRLVMALLRAAGGIAPSSARRRQGWARGRAVAQETLAFFRAFGHADRCSRIG